MEDMLQIIRHQIVVMLVGEYFTLMEKIFYLIADDYIERTYVPAELSGNVRIYEGNTKWQFGFGINKEYDFLAEIDINIKNKWLKKYVKSGFEGTKYNMGATAYLLDTSLWSGFKDSDGYAKYAVGAATLELFVESYNRTHPDKIIETQVENEKGYQVKWRSDNNYSYSISGVDASNSLYVINDNTKARASWIATPSSGNKYGTDWGKYHDMYNIRYNNMVDNEMCETCTRGSRPIVCLNSNVKLKLQDENTYFIMD